MALSLCTARLLFLMLLPELAAACPWASITVLHTNGKGRKTLLICSENKENKLSFLKNVFCSKDAVFILSVSILRCFRVFILLPPAIRLHPHYLVWR